MIMDFEWDVNKRRSDLLKHRIDFADAVGVFYDDRAITLMTLTISTNSGLLRLVWISSYRRW